MNYRPEPPQLLPTTVADGRAPGVYYRIDGELVPVLHIWLDGSVPVFFEHHIVLWKDPALKIGVRGKGALKRMIAGMQLLLTEATWAGANRVFPRRRRTCISVASASRLGRRGS